ncbi:FAD-dependent oxidoreductase [Lapidilactobacillus bayanensis]|uniref:FAD-dependent oxidoreductase n=1 Tax=Lapidilactobacillus bayanensis TaxID=2485998 RepID=UPI000F7A950B|nr:FAD-dependent oxidoreductase [Lapidilactobacillus bayanensis]
MKIVIIGGSHAGIAVASKIKNLSPKTNVTIIEATDHLGFISDTVNLMLQGLISKDNMAKGEVYTIDDIRNAGIDLRLNTSALAINRQNKTVTIQQATQQLEDIAYDYLVLAMGSADFDKLDAIKEHPNIHLLTYKYPNETLDAYETLKKSRRIMIIGAGLIGLELANSFSARSDQEVMIIERANYPLFRYFDQDIVEIMERHIPANFHIYTNQSFYQLENTPDDKISLVTWDQQRITADACVLALNPRPNTDLVKDLLDFNSDGTIKINQYMQTSDPDIFACGDLVRIPVIHANDSAYLPLVGNARKTGYIAAYNILYNVSKPYPPSQRTLATSLFGHLLGSTGITAEEARFSGYDVVEITKKYHTYAKYEADRDFYLHLKVIFDRKSREILGAQVITTDRAQLDLINIFSAMLYHHDLIDQLLEIDTFFDPEINPTQNALIDVGIESLKYRDQPTRL